MCAARRQKPLDGWARTLLCLCVRQDEFAATVDVKRPGIVTFVVDTSGSMSGEKIRQAKDGMKAALDAMAPNNQVGFLSFADQVQPGVDVAPLTENKFLIAEAVDELKADGQTALYDAISAGVQMTDAVDGDPDEQDHT